MRLVFRELEADEIEVRAKRITKYSIMLLLYKNARVDQQLLDEVVGPLNWQKSYSRDNKNCTVSIWDDVKQQWISKEDTGTESNTEAEKGLASDSFKRACVCWSIGRELYTAPDIQFPIKDTKAADGKCYDKFTVTAISIVDRKIVSVNIRDEATKIEYMFTHNGRKSVSRVEQEPDEMPVQRQKIGDTKAKALEVLLTEKHVNIEKLLAQYGVSSLPELTEAQHLTIIGLLRKAGE